MDSMSKLRARVEDRISALPDAVLCRILSFLPTVYAVETTVLSRRWKNLWTSVPNLEFDDQYYEVDFPRHVDNVLFSRNSSDIQKFSLCCNSVGDFSRVDGWIRAAIRRNVVELDLDVGSPKDAIFELPQSLFSCKTLVDLTLMSNFIIKPPTSGCFPSLKSLRVDINHPQNNSMEKLFSCCPVLESLFITGSHGKDRFWNFLYRPQQTHLGDAVLNFIISAPELKTLRIHWNSQDGYKKCCFFVAAPKLVSFDLTQNVLTDCFLENAKSLVNATIDLWEHPANEVQRFAIRSTALLAGISNVKYLFLRSHRLKKFVFDPTLSFMKGCCLPVFDNLRELELVLYYCYYWELLIEMLKRSCNLECLDLKLYADNCGHSGEFSEPRWNPPESVPICLLSRLNTITIWGFEGKPGEMEAAKYLLKNTEVLKKMTIYTRDRLCKKEEFYKEFSMFEMGSKTCQVEFI